MCLARWTIYLVTIFLSGCNRSHAVEETSYETDGMVLISGGRFMMGTDSTEVAGLRARFQMGEWEFYNPEFPQHVELLDSFWMDQTEVTNEAFARFLLDNPEWQRERILSELHNGDYLAHWSGGTYPDSIANYPVTLVSWYAAMGYCRWRGGRLPTEAEWEYAAREGGKDKEFPWGEEMPDVSRANYGASGVGGPVPVGSYPPNEFGLYDLAGNVWEYTIDEWRESYAHPRVLPSDAFLHVKTRRGLRGGSWGAADVNLRTRYRDSHPPEGAGPHVGFRCVREKR